MSEFSFFSRCLEHQAYFQCGICLKDINITSLFELEEAKDTNIEKILILPSHINPQTKKTCTNTPIIANYVAIHKNSNSVIVRCSSKPIETLTGDNNTVIKVEE